MHVLKVEAFSGLSGDMFLGALAELTEAWDDLLTLPDKLGLENVEVKITNVEKNGISCKHIKILDHNSYDTHESGHAHHHRHLKDIYKIIDEGDLSNSSKDIAKQIFLLLGEAEAKVHGVDINKIHFHEVGATDSILDIVGTAFLLDRLDIQKSFVTEICTGMGFVMTDHGQLPVPCPATKELLLGLPTFTGDTKSEMATPTGAAILKYLNPDIKIPSLIEEKTGHGPGEKDFKQPNILRLTLCKSNSETEENIYLIETNIDNMSSEVIGVDFQQQLLDKGALDFYFTQIIMKKGRPGILLSVIVSKNNIFNIADYLLENTLSIGLRYYPVSRKILDREIKQIQTSLGVINVKEVVLPSGQKRLSPEYESCASLARENQLPITQIFTKINAELNS